MPISHQNDKDSSPKSLNKTIFLSSFIKHCHSIVKMGYDRLNASSFSKSEEEDITGELIRAMETALESNDAPRWAKNLVVQEEVRIHDASRRGKMRRRVDIRIMRAQHGSRPHFEFEGKRLHNATSRSEYVGKDGLRCFLDGRYGKNDEIAGMLGYVQQGSTNSQSEEIQKMLTKNRADHALSDGGDWLSANIVTGLATYRTIHDRSHPMPRISIFHCLLQFC